MARRILDYLVVASMFVVGTLERIRDRWSR